MTEIVRLVRIDSDPTEKYEPRSEKELGIFGSTDKLTAYGNATEFLRNMEPVKVYADSNEVYPQFRIERKYLK